MHERIHLRRFDHVTRAIAFLALCIHWFNPLVWLAFFLYGRDMEMSCDEAVIKHLGNDAKKNYSTLLLALATGRKSLSGIPLAFGEGDTKGRIRNVLGFKKPAVWHTLTVLIVVVGLSVGLMANPLEPPVPDGSTNKVENMPEIPAKKLWQSRTPYIGNNSAVGNIIYNLQFPEKITPDGFALHTEAPPYAVTVKLKTDAATRNFYAGGTHPEAFIINACIMFSLIENAEKITFTLDDGSFTPPQIQITREWAESIVGADLWKESSSLKQFEKLLERIHQHVDSAIAPAEEVK